MVVSGYGHGPRGLADVAAWVESAQPGVFPWSQMIRMFDVPFPFVSVSFAAHKGEVKGVAFAKNTGQFASGGADNTARVWDIAEGVEIASFVGHTDWINDVAISADGKTLATASDDETAKTWEVKPKAKP